MSTMQSVVEMQAIDLEIVGRSGSSTNDASVCYFIGEQLLKYRSTSIIVLDSYQQE
jgi:hypothetical protein